MPTLVISPTVTASGPTRRRYRRLLASQLGWHLETVVTETAVAGEATRVVIADELRDDEAGWQWLGQPWVYVQSGAMAGTQRRVISQPEVGYRGADAMLLLSRPFDEALEVGDVIEVTSPLPATNVGHIKGMNRIIDEALERSWTEAIVTLTGNGTDSYSLDGYEYLDLGERQISGLSDTRWAASGAARARSADRPRILTNGASRTLVTETTYSASEAFYLDVVIRGDRLVFDADGASWGYPDAPGLAGDLWQAAVPERWVVTIGMVKALQELTKMAVARRDLDPEERKLVLADLAAQRAIWAAAARAIREREMPTAQATRSAPIVSPWLELV